MNNLILFFTFSILTGYTKTCAQTAYESYFLRTGEYPSGLQNDWFPDEKEIQGVTHDDNNWYFTVTNLNVFKGPPHNGYLWKIPINIDIATANLSQLGVEEISMDEVPELQSGGYHHWGDPGSYKHNSSYYILIPIPNIIACFKTNPLEFVNYAYLPPDQDYAGWCTVDSSGYIYSSNNHPSHLFRYKVDWDTLTNKNAGIQTLSIDRIEKIYDQQGNLLSLHNMQGGDFTESNELIYLNSGSVDCPFWEDGINPTDGIWVFKRESPNRWVAIQRSTSSFFNQNGPFQYNFSTNCNSCAFGFGGWYSWVQEGLTIWDIDEKNIPGDKIKGQLHVLVTRAASVGSLCDDQFSFQHYSNKFYIDKDDDAITPAWGDPLPGTKSNPFNFVNAVFAYPAYQIWDGAQMVIKAGTYNDKGVYDKRIRLTSEGGSAIIGKQ